METAGPNVPTRIALAGQTIRFWVLLLLILLIEMAVGFTILAIMCPSVLFLWIVPVVVIPITWLVYRKSTHGSCDWGRTPHLELQDGKIAFVPDHRMRSMGYERVDAPFPSGARLEYRIETGDRYIDGDHAQVLRHSLWVFEPSERGGQQLLESAGYLNIKTAAANLQIVGIPFRIIKVYDGPAAEHTEIDKTTDYIEASTKARRTTPIMILIGSSSLWLGALAGAVARGGVLIIAIGVFGFAVVVIYSVAGRSTLAKRTTLIQVVTLIPTYAGGYAAMAILIRHLFRR